MQTPTEWETDIAPWPWSAECTSCQWNKLYYDMSLLNIMIKITPWTSPSNTVCHFVLCTMVMFCEILETLNTIQFIRWVILLSNDGLCGIKARNHELGCIPQIVHFSEILGCGIQRCPDSKHLHTQRGHTMCLFQNSREFLVYSTSIMSLAGCACL